MMNRHRVLLILILTLIATGCSEGKKKAQSGGDEIGDETPLGPNSRTFIAHAALQGATAVAPASANHVLGIHQVGGNFERTVSASANFRMVSGVGVD